MNKIFPTSIILATALAALPATARTPSSVSVSGVSFVDDSGDEDCRVARGPGFAAYAADAEASAEDCDLVAGVQLPHNARMTSLSCGVLDEYLSNVFEIQLLRVDLTTGQLEYVFVTNGSVDSGLVQTLVDSTAAAGTDVVNNSRYTYYIAAAFSHTNFTSIGNAMRLYGCTIGVQSPL